MSKGVNTGMSWVCSGFSKWSWESKTEKKTKEEGAGLYCIHQQQKSLQVEDLQNDDIFFRNVLKEAHLAEIQGGFKYLPESFPNLPLSHLQILRVNLADTYHPGYTCIRAEESDPVLANKM